MTRHFLLVALCCAAAFAQTATGVLNGRVNDPSGASIPGAKVTIQNQATGVKQEGPTNSEGRFFNGFVLPGAYRVTVEKAGFGKYVQSNLTINVQQTVTLEIELKIGDTATTVEVSANAAQLATETSSISTVVTSKQILDLPLNGRNPFSLATLTPGVTPGGGGSTPWISGGRNATNEITIDGTSVILPENNVSNLSTGYTPIQDSVAEFSVITNALAAEYGRTGGGVINVATRGGSNTFHFSAYDFLRNTKLDTNTWLNNRNGVKLAAFQRNQFGFTVGGPVTIPNVYDGKNRTFFFFSEQSTRSRSASQSQASVPLPEWMAGDFSNLRNGNGAAITLYDPLTVAADNTRTAFPGNRIPSTRFDPIMVNLLKFYPKPNAVPTNAFTQQNNYFASGKAASQDDKFDSRIDHNFSAKWRVFARGSYGRGLNVPLNGFGTQGTSIGDGQNVSNQYNVTFNSVYTFSPTTIFSFNYGFARTTGVRYPFSQGIDTATLGFPSYYSNLVAVQNKEFPNISFGGNTNLSNLGQATFTTLLNRPMSHILRGDLTKVLAKHTLKFGGQWRKNFLNFTQLGQPAGQYSFAANYTQRVVGAAAVITEGNGLATALLGIPGGGSISHSFDAATASADTGFYFQDDWKVARKLTFNIGLRYDVDIPRTERYNRLSYFDLDAPSPIAGKVPGYEKLVGAMKFTGPGNRRQVPTDLNNWGPRFGWAYHVLPKTVVRGAYGILYSPSVMQAAGTSGSGGVAGFQSTSNMIVSVDNGRTIQNYLRNPFPAGFNLPLGSVEGLQSGARTDLGLGIGDSFFIDSRNPVVQQWNLNIQQELKGGWVVTTGYLGSKGQHLIDGESNMTYNQLPASFFALGTQLTQSVPNPFFGVVTNPTSTLSQPTVLRRQLLSPYPQYTSLNGFRKPQGNSVYHSFTLEAEKRFDSQGLLMLISFTGSKLIDDVSQVVTFLGAAGTKQDFYNRPAEKAVSAQDQSRRLVISSNYQLPFGKGRKYFLNMSKPAELVLGGWQVNGIATFAKGTPLQISNGGNNTNIGSPGQRPNNNGQSGVKTGAISARLNAYFDPSVFSQAPIFTFGNTGRMSPNLRSPGTHGIDFSLFKDFRATERFNIQLRAEAFNFTNSPTWNSPGTTVTAPGSFGVITAASGQRQVQLALKISY